MKTTRICFFFSLASLLLLAACSNPVKEFKQGVMAAAKDKTVSEKELANLDLLLEKALKRSPDGIALGAKRIKNHDDLVVYFTSKGNTVETGIPSVQVSLKSFRIAMELSASMKGYFGNGNSDFSEPIIALLNCGDQNTTYFTDYVGLKRANDTSVLHQSIAPDIFVQNITKGTFTAGTGSPLDQILADGIRIISDNSSDGLAEDVFCLVTDGILSGSDADIIRNRDFNENNLALLEDRIRKAVSSAKENGLECLVYRITTPFKGVFYDCRNGKVPFDGIRPYFFIIFGHPQNLRSIETTLAKETNFTSHPHYKFATYDVSTLETVTKMELRKLLGQNANIKGKVVEYDRSALTTSPVAFEIQLNLNSLPEYYLASLNENLVLSYKDKSSGTEVSIPNAEWLEEVNADPVTKVYRLTVNIPAESIRRMDSSGAMRMRLIGRQDDWYREFSVDNDVDVDPGSGKTFGLERLLGGIMKAYGYQDHTSIPDAILVEFFVKNKK